MPPPGPVPPAGQFPPGSPYRRPRRRGFFWPVVLVVVGVIALLVNLGVISPDQLSRALDLWPLALVVLGLVLIFRAWLPRLAAALTVAVLVIAIVVAGAYTSLPGVFPSALSGGTQVSDYSAPAGSAQSGRLQLRLAASTATVTSAAIPDLYQAHVEYPSGRAPRVSSAGGTVTIESREDSFFFLRPRQTQATITLNDAIPWDITVSGGAAQLTLDLGGVRLTSLEVSGGASRIETTLARPSGTVTVRVSGGASTVTLHRPSGVPVHVQMSGGASNLDVDGQHQSMLGGNVTYESPGYGTASDRYQFDVSGGASNLTIDTR